VAPTYIETQTSTIVGALELGERELQFMRDRWAGQVQWLDGQARNCQQRYYALRLAAIVGGLVVPALVSLDLHDDAGSAVAWVTFGLSLVVAVAVAVEGFFHWGDRWRHYRRTAERLLSLGWQLHGLSGAYAPYASHTEAFRPFATTVEALFAEDVDAYVTQITQERPAPPDG
jgi:hypothetical protein